MTAEILRNPMELLLLEPGNMVPEGVITHIDIKLCCDGSAYIDMGIDATDIKDDTDHIILQIDKNCIRRVDEGLCQTYKP